LKDVLATETAVTVLAVATEGAGAVTVLVVLGSTASLGLVTDSLVAMTAGLWLAGFTTTLAAVEGTVDAETDTGASDVVMVTATLLGLTAATFCSSICRCLSRSASVSLCSICFCSSGPASGDVATSVERTVAVISGELPVRVSWSTSRARSTPAMLVDADVVGTSLDTALTAVVYKTQQPATVPVARGRITAATL